MRVNGRKVKVIEGQKYHYNKEYRGTKGRGSRKQHNSNKKTGQENVRNKEKKKRQLRRLKITQDMRRMQERKNGNVRISYLKWQVKFKQEKNKKQGIEVDL